VREMPMKRILMLLVFLFSISLVYNLNVSAETGNSSVIDINKVKVEVNGQKSGMGTIFFEEVTYVPLRTISEAFGKVVTWDAKTGTAKINDSSAQPVKANPQAKTETNTKVKDDANPGKAVAAIFSTAFLFTGAVLLFQIIFLRNRKDLNVILRSLSVSSIGLKRMIYTGWVSKIGFGYLLFGLILKLYSTGVFINTTLHIIIDIILIVIFWLLGLWISKVISRKQYIQEFETPERVDDTNENGSFNLF
jgi:hypothetical protein